MSRGPGRRQREILATCQEWRAEYPDGPDYWWVPLTDLAAETPSESESIRRAAQALEKRGLVQRRRSAPLAWWHAKSRRRTPPLLVEFADAIGMDPRMASSLFGIRQSTAASWVRLPPKRWASKPNT